VLRNVTESIDDLQGETVVGEKVLSQLGRMLWTARGNDLRHVDPLFLGL
jgi:hypothetical protein